MEATPEVNTIEEKKKEEFRRFKFLVFGILFVTYPFEVFPFISYLNIPAIIGFWISIIIGGILLIYLFIPKFKFPLIEKLPDSHGFFRVIYANMRKVIHRISVVPFSGLQVIPQHFLVG